MNGKFSEAFQQSLRFQTNSINFIFHKTHPSLLIKIPSTIQYSPIYTLLVVPQLLQQRPNFGWVLRLFQMHSMDLFFAEHCRLTPYTAFMDLVILRLFTNRLYNGVYRRRNCFMAYFYFLSLAVWASFSFYLPPFNGSWSGLDFSHCFIRFHYILEANPKGSKSFLV